MKKIVTFLFILMIILLAATVLLHVRSCGEDLFHKTDITEKLPPIDDSLRIRIDTFLYNNFPQGSIGIELYDITADKEVYSYNKDSLMIPASCMKLLTCVTALRYIGAEKLIHNRLYTSGYIMGDTLNGNVILKTQYDTAFNRDTLNNLVNELKNKGVTYIKGNVIVDMMLTEPLDHEEHWIIGDLRTRYMGLNLQGLLRMKKEMLGALQAKGIKIIDGTITIGKLNPRNATLIADNTATLHTLVEKSLKASSNINAETLLMPLGYIYDKKGNYRENGKKVLQNFIRNEMNINPATVCNIDDGCGLCINDKLTADFLVKLLVYSAKRPRIYNEIINDMPLSGVDGTLYKRMHDSRLKGKLRGKTGTLTRNGGVSTLAGYFIGKDNHLIAYAILNNGWYVETSREWQDKLCLKAFMPQRIMGELKDTTHIIQE